MSTRNIGIALVVAGVLLLLVSLLADVFGIGAHPEIVGWKQIMGAGTGVVLAAAGIFLVRRK